MAEARVERRLAAILATEALKDLRKSFINPKIAEHRGRFVKTTGDGAWSSSRAPSTRRAAQWKSSAPCPIAMPTFSESAGSTFALALTLETSLSTVATSSGMA